MTSVNTRGSRTMRFSWDAMPRLNTL